MPDFMLPGFSSEQPTHSNDYVFSSLTYEIKDKQSPLRKYFDSLVKDLRGLQRDYRVAAGPMLIDWTGVNAGTLGAAFDFAIRFRLDPMYDADVARSAFTTRPEILAGVDAVIRRAQLAATERSWNDLHASCWAIALFTEVYRVGLTAGSPLQAFLTDGEMDVDGLLAVVPNDASRELGDLMALAESRLLPALNGPFDLGPTFAGSAFCKADADLIASGCLLDLKTRIGERNARTKRCHDDLRNVDVYQMLGYALFDLDDEYGITRLGIYSSRYGHLTRWGIVDFIERIACRSVDIEEERARIRYLLSGETRGERKGQRG